MRLPVVQLLKLAHVRPREVDGQQEVRTHRPKVQERREQPPQLQLEDGRLPVQEQKARPLVPVKERRNQGDANANLETAGSGIIVAGVH